MWSYSSFSLLPHLTHFPPSRRQTYKRTDSSIGSLLLKGLTSMAISVCSGRIKESIWLLSSSTRLSAVLRPMPEKSVSRLRFPSIMVCAPCCRVNWRGSGRQAETIENFHNRLVAINSAKNAHGKIAMREHSRIFRKFPAPTYAILPQPGKTKLLSTSGFDQLTVLIRMPHGKIPQSRQRRHFENWSLHRNFGYQLSHGTPEQRHPCNGQPECHPRVVGDAAA
jgi:hypothetical protein